MRGRGFVFLLNSCSLNGERTVDGRFHPGNEPGEYVLEPNAMELSELLATLEYRLENVAFYCGARRTTQQCWIALEEIILSDEFQSWPETKRSRVMESVSKAIAFVDRIAKGETPRPPRVSFSKLLEDATGWISRDHQGCPGCSTWHRP